MKLYIITIEDIYDYDSEHHDPIVRTNLREARKVLTQLYRSGKEIYQDSYDTFEKSRNCFSMYTMGTYGESHYSGVINVIDVPNIKRKVVKSEK